MLVRWLEADDEDEEGETWYLSAAPPLRTDTNIQLILVKKNKTFKTPLLNKNMLRFVVNKVWVNLISQIWTYYPHVKEDFWISTSLFDLFFILIELSRFLKKNILGLLATKNRFRFYFSPCSSLWISPWISSDEGTSGLWTEESGKSTQYGEWFKPNSFPALNLNYCELSFFTFWNILYQI